MKRKIEPKLIAWRDRKDRKPLLINGARQVGKSYILDWFGENYFDSYVRISLDKNDLVRNYLKENIDPHHIIQFIETLYNKRLEQGKSLIVFDEIQSSSRALLSLKYFCEEAPEYHIAAAGSLLGVAVSREEEYSYPVGKVNELQMFPLDFEEFLWANGKELLAEKIKEHYRNNEPMSGAEHELALSFYKQYLIIGGMPKVVTTFIETNSYINVAEEQKEILDAYLRDMSKYATPVQSVKIRACYNSIPAQLAKENKKFQYKMVKKGATSTLFGETFDWLEQSGIILKCNKIEHGFLPISVYRDLGDFKVYMSDTGMLTMKTGIPAAVVLSSGEIANTFLGALTENYVAQTLSANGFPLYYWKGNNTMELDFVIQNGTDVIPIEVKTGIRVKSQSLNFFIKEYKCRYAYRISQKNFGYENGIKSIPLYATFCI